MPSQADTHLVDEKMDSRFHGNDAVTEIVGNNYKNAKLNFKFYLSQSPRLMARLCPSQFKNWQAAPRKLD